MEKRNVFGEYMYLKLKNARCHFLHVIIMNFTLFLWLRCTTLQIFSLTLQFLTISSERGLSKRGARAACGRLRYRGCHLDADLRYLKQ